MKHLILERSKSFALLLAVLSFSSSGCGKFYGAPSGKEVRALLERQYPSEHYRITDIDFEIRINHDMAGRKTETRGYGYTMQVQQTDEHPKGANLPETWHCVLMKNDDGGYLAIAGDKELFKRASD